MKIKLTPILLSLMTLFFTPAIMAMDSEENNRATTSTEHKNQKSKKIVTFASIAMAQKKNKRKQRPTVETPTPTQIASKKRKNSQKPLEPNNNEITGVEVLQAPNGRNLYRIDVERTSHTGQTKYPSQYHTWTPPFQPAQN